MRGNVIGVCLALVIGSTVACVGSRSVTCDDGRVCPTELVCDNVHGKCVTQNQLAVCKDQPKDTVCPLPDGRMGGCLDGVCLEVGCGNGVVEASEVCDDGNEVSGDGCSANCDSNEACGNSFLDTIKGEACDCGDASVPDNQRPPGCNGANSDAEGSVCLANCKIRGCGDGIVSGLEDCDASDLRSKTCADVGFYGGTLACSSLCRFDVGGCTGKCGDGSVNGPAGDELCDGADLASKDCTTFGYYDAAGLQCNALCGFDTSACTGRCGDGAKNGPELCDGTQLGGTSCTNFGFYMAAGLTCTTACNFDTSACGGGYCGDAAINGGVEKCDGTQLGGKTCSDFGYYQPTGLACNQICDYDMASCTGGRCGDGVKNGPELCDAADLGGKTCADYGYYGTSGLACTAACGITTVGCTGGFCGDGLVQTAAGEECDGNNLDGGTCTSEGFYSGTLACGPGCKYNVGGCTGTCGDGVKNGTETCDGSDFAGQGCANYGFYTGSLACNGTCSAVVTTGCSLKCGDGIKNGSEACDGSAVGSLTCGSFGYYGGTLGCNGTCSAVVTSSCAGRCGDNVINGGEDCDGTALAGADCTDFGFYNGTGLQCSSLCAIDDSACTGYCGDRTVNGPAGWTEECDSQQPSSSSCLTWGYESGPLGCRADCGVDFAGCVRTGWYAMTANTSSYIGGVWGTGPSDVWAVGYPFQIRHWDGTSWTTSEQGGPGSYSGVWGSATNNVFVAGDNGTIKRWNGSTWLVLTTNSTQQLYSVWGDGTGTVIATGYNGTILRSTNNGTSWSSVSSTTTNALQAVWGSSASNIFAVGWYGTIVRSTDGGASWSPMTSPTGSFFYGVWGAAADKVYVVGTSGTVLQLSGTTWLPMTTNTTQALRGVWGASTTDIFAVGDQSIMHWDGVSWSQAYTGATYGLGAIWGGVWSGGSPPDVFAVGGGGTILRYSREAWTAATNSLPAANLFGVWGSSVSDVYITGPTDQIAHYDGSTWTAEAISPIGGAVYDLWGSSASNVFAVGQGGKYLRYTGSWSVPATTGQTNTLRGIYGFGANDIFAVGDSGTIVRWTGSWSTMTSGTTFDLQEVWGPANNDVFAVGGNGTIRHWNGSQWSEMYANTAEFLTSVWGSSSKDVYATGINGTLFHYNGTSWTPMRVFTAATLRDVWGTGPNDIYITGDSGRVWHYDGARFSEMRTDVAQHMNAIWGTGANLFIAGSLGTILQRNRYCSTSEAACSDNRDDDCDGLIDCADPNCASAAFCTGGGLCAAAAPLNCNTSSAGSLAGGKTNLVASSCDAKLRNGREQTYKIQRTTTGTITLSLSGLTNDVDVQVFAQTGGGACNPYSPGCLTVSANTGKAAEDVVFTAQANTPYYVVIDSYGGYAASYTLGASCP